MKLLFCDNTLWGLINFRGPIIRHLHSKGYDIVLVAPEKEDEQMQTSVPSGIRYIPVKMCRTSKNPFNDLKFLHRLIKIYKKEKPDYVFNYTIKPNIYGTIAARICGANTTAMMAGLGYAFTENNMSANIARRLYKFGLSFTHHLFLLNESNKSTIRKFNLCNEKKIILLTGGEGVECDKFQYKDNISEKTTFLFVGRILYEKGYREFVEAAKKVRDKYPHGVSFELIGSLDPQYPNSVSKEQIEQDEHMGYIKYRGFTNDMTNVYSEKGLVITLPTFYGEGMNRSLMEACACGKPIITTNIPGCKETVDDKQNGYLIPTHNSDALAEAMIRYIELSNEEKENYSKHSRKIALERFNIQTVISEYEKIINR